MAQYSLFVLEVKLNPNKRNLTLPTLTLTLTLTLDIITGAGGVIDHIDGTVHLADWFNRANCFLINRVQF